MRERLFQPLGISTGGFGALPKTFGTDKTGQAWGHSPVLGKPLDPRSPAAELPLFYGPAGLAHMTITDWAKFIRLHLRGDPANPHCQAALLKLDTFAEMHAVAPGAFALNPVGTTSTSSQIHPANGDDVEVIPTRGGRSFMAREPAYSNGWVIRGLNWVAMGDAAPAVTYSAGWFISTASWARGTRHGDTGHYFWHGGRGGMSHSVVCIAPEIDFAVLVACNRDIAILKTRQALKALIRAFAPKRT
jgi:CubicO group peptidase (beta-lactamase class C family)